MASFGSGLLWRQFGGDHVGKLRHGFLYLFIAFSLSLSNSSARCSISFRSFGESRSSILRLASCTLRRDSIRPSSHFVSNSVSARDSSAAPGGGIYITGGYNPTWILRLPGGRTLSSRSRCPIASIGHPRCACQLYECRKSTNSSAASPALQWSWIFPLIVPTYGCTSTPSLVSLTTLSGLLHDLSPH